MQTERPRLHEVLRKGAQGERMTDDVARAMVTGRYSNQLIAEFDAHIENRTANVFPMFAEIETLEGANTSFS